ncbi:diguanylate cyclase [Christensenella timonensis]|uniref:diguanylate cyclase n=1 Tax=Christensenella timonensis TaxID=1816678 RepID=UPI000835D6E2|nr:transporter substrate-binding domain-containing protein [Christensenella timonensis]
MYTGIPKKLHMVCACMVALLFLAGAFFPVIGHAQEKKNTIRVAYPIQHGLTELDENGNYSGYTYEYLQEIAQYTGWDLEFVQFAGEVDEQLNSALETVQSGEVDVMGGIVYNEELAKMYDYPSYNYGTGYSTLNVLEDNTKINETNLKTLDNIRIAIYEKAVTRNAELQQFCEANGLSPEIISFDSLKGAEDAVRDGQADAMIGNDLTPVEGMRSVANFAPKPYYFIATKGDTEIVNGLNAAILKINDADPYFATTLYEKYFKNDTGKLYLSDEEQEYVQNAGTIRVGVTTGRAPFQYVDEQSGEAKGISIDLLDYISESTGLSFQIVTASDYDELMQLVNDGDVEMIAGMNYDYDTAAEYGAALTRPFITSQSVLVLNKKAENSDLTGKKVAVVEGTILPEGYEEEVVVLWYTTPEACISAVNKGEVDYTYGDGYAVQYYVNQSRYENVVLIPQSSQTQKLCFGIVKPADANLLSTINKAIRSIPTETMQSIMNSNTIRPQDKVTWTDYVESNPWEVLAAVIVLAAAVIVLLALFSRRRARLSRKVALENERFRQLYDLSNEYIFEYNFEKDEMIFSERSARLFDSERVVGNYFAHLQEASGEGKDISEAFGKLKEEGGTVEDVQVKLPDGKLHWLRITAKAVYDSEGKLIMAIGKIVDIQEEREEKDRLLAQAQNDSLTNIYNAASCREKVDGYLRQAKEGRAGALLILDIDHFKSINDRYGHYVGDQVLIKTAEVLKKVFRVDDVVGRLGGDEFCIFMKGAHETRQVRKKYEEVRSELRKRIELQGGELTVSVGAAFTEKGQDFTEVYKKADAALYVVKERSRDGIEII